MTVTKSDAETGTAQGDASLAGAVYGIYKGETLVDSYATDKNGQFTSKEYICDSDWTVREITRPRAICWTTPFTRSVQSRSSIPWSITRRRTM